MKTLTEFAVITLKNASKIRQELISAGKTAEELPQAMGEALKLEGDKLTNLLAALDVAGAKTEDLKRVVVFTLAEGEKAPYGAKQVGEQHFLAEYYPSASQQKAAAAPANDRGGRGGKGGDRKGKGGGGGRGGERGDRRGPPAGGEGRGPGAPEGRGEGRGPRGPGRAPQQAAGAGAPSMINGQPVRRAPMIINPANAAAKPAGVKPVIKPLAQPKAIAPAAAAPAPAESASTATSEENHSPS